MEFHWADQGAAWLEVLSGILDIAGSNYNPPYDSDSQPTDGASRNLDDLLQYQLPGGTSYQGYADPSYGESIGSSINTLIANVSGFMSAFGLILPILGVIRGIIEVLCALINPFAVIRAIIRLFKKWIPPFISLFPPLAGVIIVLSTIKLILSIVFYFLTVLIPMIQLIVRNINLLAESFGPNGDESQREAAREKLLALLLEILNQLGVLAVFKPILDLIFAILELVAGFPCKGGNDDSSCCTSETCPPLFSNLPKGRGILVPAFFGDSPPMHAWMVYTLTGNRNMRDLKKYMQCFNEQLSAMLDEEVEEADYAGGTGDSSTFKVKVTGARGDGQTVETTMIKLFGTVAVVLNPELVTKVGLVEYEVVPNWENLIKYNIVGMGCHPDVANAKAGLETAFENLDKSVLESNPELTDLDKNFTNNMGNMNRNLNIVRNAVMNVVFDGGDDIDVNSSVRTPNYGPTTNALDAAAATTNIVTFFPNVTDPNINLDDIAAREPPYDDYINEINTAQDDIVDSLLAYTEDLKDIMNRVLSRNVHKSQSNLDVDKHVAKAGGQDKVMIYVVPRDATGTPLLKDLPNGVDVRVSIFSDFGILGEQIEDRVTGVVSAELISPFPGDAKITAKVNTDFIQEFAGDNLIVRELDVKFVSDATLPKRRLISKPSVGAKRRKTSGNTEREPGGK
jgi:hypothetical protein